MPAVAAIPVTEITRQFNEAGRLGIAANSLVTAQNARRLGWAPSAPTLDLWLDGAPAPFRTSYRSTPGEPQRRRGRDRTEGAGPLSDPRWYWPCRRCRPRPRRHRRHAQGQEVRSPALAPNPGCSVIGSRLQALLQVSACQDVRVHGYAEFCPELTFNRLCTKVRFTPAAAAIGASGAGFRRLLRNLDSGPRSLDSDDGDCHLIWMGNDGIGWRAPRLRSVDLRGRPH